MLLRQMLYRCEPRFLSVIASFWLNLRSTPNYEELIRMLCDRMTDPAVLKKKLNSPEWQEFLSLFQYLIQKDGIEESEGFEAMFGPFRVAGTDRIMREKLWKNPVSHTESLRYRGLIFREIRPMNEVLKDCYVLPEDLLKIISGIIPMQAAPTSTVPVLTVRPAIPSETAFVAAEDKSLPDLFCLGLALKRDERMLTFPGLDVTDTWIRFLDALISDSVYFDDTNNPNTEAIRNFLIHNRTSARISLLRIWRNTENYNELIESPEINVLTDPVFSKTKPRGVILKLLSDLSPDTWISANGFLAAVKKAHPQFLRDAFREERWQLQDTEGNDLSGIGAWYQMEGAYLRFLLSGPLSWLGLAQCAFSEKDHKELTAFRLSQDVRFYLAESEQPETAEEILSKPNLEQALPTISGDGEIACSTKVPRYFRYMAARYAEIEKVDRDRVVFRLTPASLSEAERFGLSKTSLLSLLRRFSGNKVPPTLERMLSAPDNTSHTALIYSATILTVPDEAILAELLNTSRLEKWILQQINPTSLLIDPKGITEIRRFLMEKELFVDIKI